MRSTQRDQREHPRKVLPTAKTKAAERASAASGPGSSPEAKPEGVNYLMTLQIRFSYSLKLQLHEKRNARCSNHVFQHEFEEIGYNATMALQVVSGPDLTL